MTLEPDKYIVKKVNKSIGAVILCNRCRRNPPPPEIIHDPRLNQNTYNRGAAKKIYGCAVKALNPPPLRELNGRRNLPTSPTHHWHGN